MDLIGVEAQQTHTLKGIILNMFDQHIQGEVSVQYRKLLSKLARTLTAGCNSNVKVIGTLNPNERTNLCEFSTAIYYVRDRCEICLLGVLIPHLTRGKSLHVHSQARAAQQLAKTSCFSLSDVRIADSELPVEGIKTPQESVSPDINSYTFSPYFTTHYTTTLCIPLNYQNFLLLQGTYRPSSWF